MFTGLVEGVGRIVCFDRIGSGVRLTIGACLNRPHRAPDEIFQTSSLGDSLAINGCCLTVVARENGELQFELGPETLSKTNLGNLKPGDLINLERPVLPTTRMGGHFVQGHVDGLGEIVRFDREGEWVMIGIAVPKLLMKWIAPKGSIAVDGVSLTVVDTSDNMFTVSLIPHTLANTTIGEKNLGDSANIETDILAKYVQNILGKQ